MSGFLTTFALDGISLHKIIEIMWKDYKIQIAATGADGRPIFRISTHFYDNFEDIDRFVDVLKEVLENRHDEVKQDDAGGGRWKRGRRR